jgi:hypothetical protein
MSAAAGAELRRGGDLRVRLRSVGVARVRLASPRSWFRLFSPLLISSRLSHRGGGAMSPRLVKSGFPLNLAARRL